MPPKRKKPAVGPVSLPTKASFFESKREFCGIVPKAAKAPVVVKQRLLYHKETGVPYAEIIDNAAVCLETGQELFRFKDKAVNECMISTRFDFTPPSGKKHPDDRTVDVLGLVAAGILSNEDVARRRAFSEEELSEMTKKLDEYQAEREAISAFRMN